MKLSKLVYLCIKNVIYFDDTSFSLEEFLKGSFNSHPDYATNINNVFSQINESIARLSDLERIPYLVEYCEVTDNIIELNQCSKSVKEVISVAQNTYKGFKAVEHRPFGLGKVYLASYSPYSDTYIEYKEDIPMFDETYMPFKNYNDELEENPLDVDLKEYGINDSMCNYIIEYVKGKLFEQENPDVANMHITRAEQYFNNIKPSTSAFSQQVVRTVYGVGD
jgi:hypothetical protein